LRKLGNSNIVVDTTELVYPRHRDSSVSD